VGCDDVRCIGSVPEELKNLDNPPHAVGYRLEGEIGFLYELLLREMTQLMTGPFFFLDLVVTITGISETGCCGAMDRDHARTR